VELEILQPCLEGCPEKGNPHPVGPAAASLLHQQYVKLFQGIIHERGSSYSAFQSIKMINFQVATQYQVHFLRKPAAKFN
jgi:hypothetical protein